MKERAVLMYYTCTVVCTAHVVLLVLDLMFSIAQPRLKGMKKKSLSRHVALTAMEKFDLKQKGWLGNVMLVIGTSGLVYPAAKIPSIAIHNKAITVQINPTSTDFDLSVTYNLVGKAGEILPTILEQL